MDRILIRKVRKRIRGFRIRKSTLRFRNTAIYADAESLHFADEATKRQVKKEIVTTCSMPAIS